MKLTCYQTSYNYNTSLNKQNSPSSSSSFTLFHFQLRSILTLLTCLSLLLLRTTHFPFLPANSFETPFPRNLSQPNYFPLRHFNLLLFTKFDFFILLTFTSFLVSPPFSSNQIWVFPHSVF